MSADWNLLENLYATIHSRKTVAPATSYTASLFAAGRPKIAQKLGEEAVETVVAALSGDATETAKESADLLYHLLVLWAEMGLEPGAVLAILEQRTATSGLEEKRGREKK